MMTIEKCKKLLADRVSHAKQSKGYGTNPDGTLKGYHHGLYLLEGDLVQPSGWTQREIEQAPRIGTRAERLQFMHYHWFPEWDRIDRERQKLRDKKEDEAARERAWRRWLKCGVPPRYAEMEIDDLDFESDEISAEIKKVYRFPWWGGDDDPHELETLAIHGTPGTRKTQLAASWLRERVLDMGVDGQFVSAEQLVRDARDADAMQRYMTVDSLVIDDIGVDPKDVDVVLRVVDARLNNGLRNVYTTNASPTQLKEKYGPRGFSRLRCNAQIVLIEGRDWRRNP
jgi:DNA replication protein DnaC